MVLNRLLANDASPSEIPPRYHHRCITAYCLRYYLTLKVIARNDIRQRKKRRNDTVLMCYGVSYLRLFVSSFKRLKLCPSNQDLAEYWITAIAAIAAIAAMATMGVISTDRTTVRKRRCTSSITVTEFRNNFVFGLILNWENLINMLMKFLLTKNVKQRGFVIKRCKTGARLERRACNACDRRMLFTSWFSKYFCL